MPGPAVHYIVGKDLTRGFPFKIDYKPNAPRKDHLFDPQTIGILNEHPIYRNFGTLGPDFLFFNVKDWPAGEFIPVKQMIKFAEILKSLEVKIEESFPALIKIKELKEDLEEVVDDVIASSAILLTIKLFIDDIKAIIGLIGSIVKEGLKDLVTSNIDIYSFLSSPIQVCEPKNNWWWFDVLHYSKTGEFAEYLLKNSKHNDALHAYAIGYLSHVAADSVGHPYVNNIVRGPYRTHSQRHNVVEKFQDVSAFNFFESKEFSTSELHEEFKFNDRIHDLYTGAPVPDYDSIIDGLTPGLTDVGLPKEIAKLFAEATQNVYNTPGGHPFGGGMTEEEVDASYRLWYSWFKATTSEAILPDSLPDLPPLTEEIREVWNRFRDKFNNALDELDNALEDLFSGGGSSFSLKGLANFFKKIARIIEAAVAAAAAFIEAIEETIASISKQAVHFMLNKVYQALYVIYDYFRLSVSLNGLAFPGVRHLDDSKVRHMLNPIIEDVRGNRLSNSWPYPIKHVDVGTGIWRTASQEAHLVYPSLLKPELDLVTPAPLSYTSNVHTYYIKDDVGIDLNFINQFAPIQDFISHNLRVKNEVLGNASELTGALYDNFQKGKKLPNINLDADRGIGYPCWEPEGCENDNIKEPVNPKFNH
ncbi:zinc dependent phospholipase C family protein [Leeuwenhoekiella sp. NPDC079379]|uniref:zinc dependent phospholipase C family protein n=1 Tax=Leeuwenhoekiella sp. NPDC079379 TaxID=3364122 RepID=UPI0037CC5FC1